MNFFRYTKCSILIVFITLTTHDIVCKLTSIFRNKSMKFALLILFSTSLAFAQNLGEVSSFKDIEHKNKGCPINSDCSKTNGILMQQWNKIFIHEKSAKRFKLMKKFSVEHGLPLQFLADKDVKKQYDPILWNSRCRHHNPKNPNNNIYQGMMFTKSIPLKGDLNFDPVYVFHKGKATKYMLPYQDKPFFIKGDRVYILKDYDDYFYQISVGKKGDFRLENEQLSIFTKSTSKKIKEFPCPENKIEKSDLYTSTYCQKVWDIDTNEMKTVQVFWSCP